MADKQDNLELMLCRYLDGELDPRQRADLERRMAEEPSLREDLARYQALGEALTGLGEEEVPGIDYEAQRSAIMERLERRALLRAPAARRVLIFRGVLTGLAAAAVVLIAATIAINLFHGTGPVVTPPDTPQGSASMAMLRPEGAATGGTSGTVSVAILPVDVMELPLSTASELGDSREAPSGTIAVSVGESRKTSLPPVTWTPMLATFD
jgi:anti-sigma factor RsiW